MMVEGGNGDKRYEKNLTEEPQEYLDSPGVFMKVKAETKLEVTEIKVISPESPSSCEKHVVPLHGGITDIFQSRGNLHNLQNES